MINFTLEGLPEGWTPDAAMISVANAFTAWGPQRDIATVGLALTHLLLLKNQRYGNSALDPVAIFAPQLSARERMAVRMDDKLSRISRGLGTNGGDGEHPGVDLAGYLLLDIIAEYYARPMEQTTERVTSTWVPASPPCTREEEETFPPDEAYNHD